MPILTFALCPIIHIMLRK